MIETNMKSSCVKLCVDETGFRYLQTSALIEAGDDPNMYAVWVLEPSGSFHEIVGMI